MAPGRRTLVVILTYNSAPFIRACLRSVERHTRLDEVKVVVADNASSDGTLDIVRAEFPWAAALATGSNLGVSRGNNLVLARHEADDYVLLNPDTEVRERWLDALSEEAASDPRIGVVGAKLLFPDGTIQHAGGMAAPFGPYHLGYRAPADTHGEPRDVDYVTFALALVKREVIERIGYLDEAYTPYYYEDSDFCYRARRAGFRVRYQPASVAVHHEGAAMVKRPSAARVRLVERNRLRHTLVHDPPSFWARGTVKEAKTLAGHLFRGRGGAMLRAYWDTARALGEIRARRRAPAVFVPSQWSPPDRHAPTVPWEAPGAGR